jgi:uncharacterized membrane protein
MSYRNQSTLDRIIRIVLGVAMLALGWSGAVEGIWGIALRIFAWVPLVTGLIGWCPFYAILGLSTRKPRPPRPVVQRQL